jgi:hypothetical protein
MDQPNAPYLLVGLGNPGREYRETRHNVGFMVIDKVCKTAGIGLSRVQSKAIIGVGQFAGRRLVLAKPQTFMNLSVLDEIRSLKSYQRLLADLSAGMLLPGLALLRSARLPVLAALREDLNRPVLLLTDRADRALTLLDELAFWAPSTRASIFPEPNPLFYEQAAWGTLTRRDRLQALTMLASYHARACRNLNSRPVLVASVRALMTRTLPRREFSKPRAC